MCLWNIKAVREFKISSGILKSPQILKNVRGFEIKISKKYMDWKKIDGFKKSSWIRIDVHGFENFHGFKKRSWIP